MMPGRGGPRDSFMHVQHPALIPHMHRLSGALTRVDKAARLDVQLRMA